MKSKKKQTVFVALSGGVDSAATAGLLKKQGYSVVGVFMRQFDVSNVSKEDTSQLACSWEFDRRSAMSAAATLDIPFKEWDFRKQYHKEVVNYMFREYKAGRTPNPDAMCNKYIKFDAFLKKALKEGADYIATGHYVRCKQSVVSSKQKAEKRKEYKLYQAKDKDKNQSYFLYSLAQEQLKYCLFPLGEYLKSDVRKMAKKFGLPQWNKKDSQGICFVGKIPMKDYLQTKIPMKPGALTTVDGKVVGTHHGAAYYTIGQRHGLGFVGGDDPYYVVSKDMKHNVVFVAKGNAKELYKKDIKVSDMHWISGIQPVLPMECSAGIRYRQPLQRAVVTIIHHSSFLIQFNKPQRAVTPGQAIVFYKGQEMVGGGIIL
ncbi:MAG: tRNA 2-thiouridine(34) synthase MnmA [bacterium]|nr:tRNA 2-thiouridine(34) synthase MnmA [bacterium]